jgi:very-short-patch-repair endonuclease
MVITGPLPPADVVRRLGGTATLSQLLEHTTRYRVDHAVIAGDLWRPSRGHYVLPGLPSAVRAAARAHGVVSHTSAARRLGLPLLLRPRAVHVTVPHGARPPPSDKIVYHWRSLNADEIELGATTAVRTVLDCAAWLPFPEGLAATDAALRLGVVDAAVLAGAAGQLTGRGSRQARRVVAVATDLAESVLESALRAILLDAGISWLSCQLTIECADGSARVDLADEGRRLVIEADSYAHHGEDRAAFERDCRRYDELVRAGWTVLRFTWNQVLFDPGWVVAVVRDTLAAATRCTSSGILLA